MPESLSRPLRLEHPTTQHLAPELHGNLAKIRGDLPDSVVAKSTKRKKYLM